MHPSLDARYAVTHVLIALTKGGKLDTTGQQRGVAGHDDVRPLRRHAFNPVRDAVTVRKPTKRSVRTIDLEETALLR